MFKVEVIGNIGADAEVITGNGGKFVSFRVANTDKWTTDSGEKREATTWIDVTMSNTESKVLPYLKSGVKVFVRGNASLRVYSSPKLRLMMAGIQVAATEVELCGGQAEAVPRQLIEPETGALVDVTKYYWCNAETKGMKAADTRMLLDTRANQYLMNNKGFVAPMPQQEETQDEQSAQTESQENKA